MYLLVLLYSLIQLLFMHPEFLYVMYCQTLNNLETTRQVNDVAILLFMAYYKPCDSDLQYNYSEYRQKRNK